MYSPLRLSAIVATPIFAKGSYDYYNFNSEAELYKSNKKQPMTVMSSSCYKNGRNIETSDLNKYVLNGGLKDVVKVSQFSHYVMKHPNFRISFFLELRTSLVLFS